MTLTDRPPQLLRHARQPRIAIELPFRFEQHRLAQRLELQRGEDGADVAKGLVKRRRLGGSRVPQLRPDRIQHRVTEFVGDDVGTLAAVDGDAARPPRGRRPARCGRSRR